MKRETTGLLAVGTICATALTGCAPSIEGKALPLSSAESCRAYLSLAEGYPDTDIRGFAAVIRACYDHTSQNNRQRLGATMLGVSFATKDGRQERFAVESEVGPSDVSFVDKAKRVQFDLLRGSDDASSPIYDYNVALNGEGAHWFAPKTMVDATLRDSKGKPSVVISRSNGMGATMDSADAVECVRSEVADQLRIQLLFSGGAPVNLTMPSIECTQAD